MTKEALYRIWLSEEQCAHIHGWDFSHIHGRYQEEDDLPWDYRQIILQYLQPDHQILDLDTGGGEFLLSLHHPYHNTSATEAYPPNVALCRETLLPLGIQFQEAKADGPLPFPDNTFDLILNRHGTYNPKEIFRLLKPGGHFITQQVGAENDRALTELLLSPVPPMPFPEQRLSIARRSAEEAGLKLLDGQEAFRPIRFWDVGALVWFARMIEWEFPGFSVDACFDRLLTAQTILERDGVIEGKIHRFLLIAEKPKK